MRKGKAQNSTKIFTLQHVQADKSYYTIYNITACFWKHSLNTLERCSIFFDIFDIFDIFDNFDIFDVNFDIFDVNFDIFDIFDIFDVNF